MNKLISRNPVLRFKEGRKIVKGENGIGRWFYNGKEVFSDDGGKTFKLNNSGTLTGSPGAIKNLVKADKVGRTGYKVRDTWYLMGTGKKATSFISSALPKKEYIPLGQVAATREKYLGNNSTKVIPSKSTIIDNVFINGYLTNDDITLAGGVRAMQLKLKDAGYDLGKFGVDGKWGRDTQKAYDDWKLKLQIAFETPSLEDTISAAQNLPILSTPTINPSEYTFTESQLSGLGENPYYEPHPELRFNNFDRTQTRQWLRDNGFNPYSLTGALRKALRMIMNGLGTELDKNLVGLTGGLTELLTKYNYLKKGGNINKLPSRNIVERFKNRFNKN